MYYISIIVVRVYNRDKMGSSSGGNGGSGGVAAVCLDSGANGTNWNPADPLYISFF